MTLSVPPIVDHAAEQQAIDRKLTPVEAIHRGLTIDTTCYPWLAYAGPRFNPTEKHDCWTDYEADRLTLARLVQRYFELPNLRVSALIQFLEARLASGKKPEYLPRDRNQRIMHLIEELGELLQALGKGGRFGIYNTPEQRVPRQPANIHRILDEVSDVIRVAGEVRADLVSDDLMPTVCCAVCGKVRPASSVLDNECVNCRH